MLSLLRVNGYCNACTWSTSSFIFLPLKEEEAKFVKGGQAVSSKFHPKTGHEVPNGEER